MTYAFKHALIQETAYQSLLRSKRRQYHRQTVRILEQRSPEIAMTQPELLAYHYTEAGLPAQALPSWQRAGERAVGRWANIEAIIHFTKGLDPLGALPRTPERTRQELALLLALAPPLRMIRGHATREVEGVYTRAHELSQQVGEDWQQGAALIGLGRFYSNGARLQRAHELCEQCLTLAQRAQHPVFLLEAHQMFGLALLWLGDLVTAHRHLEQGIALYDVQQGYSRTSGSGMDPEVVCLSGMAWMLWLLGYPDRALTKIREALILAQELSHAYSLGFALNYATMLHAGRREVQFVKERAEAVIILSTEHGFYQFLSVGMIREGWALAKQGSVAEGIAQLHLGLAALRHIGTELALSHHLALLAEAYRRGGQVETGRHVLTKPLTHLDKHRGALLRGGAVSAQRRVPTGADRQAVAGERSGGMFSSGPRRRPPPAGEVSGVTLCDEPGSPVSSARQRRGSPPDTGGDLWLVHRGI